MLSAKAAKTMPLILGGFGHPRFNFLTRDPRHFQLIALSAFLTFGVLERAFAVTPVSAAAIFAAALSTQAVTSRITGHAFDWKSPTITALSLTILLRASNPAILAAAAVIAIGSKALLRVDGKHLFNPANIGIVSLVFLFDEAWTTPGQWGAATIAAAIMAGAGAIVASKARRLDTPLIFLGAFALLTFGRALWLGDPMTIPMRQMQNGALILFAFFMISDPKTTPDGWAARAVFCVAVATLGFILTRLFFINDGVFLALALACLTRPLLEKLQPGVRYAWPSVDRINSREQSLAQNKGALT